MIAYSNNGNFMRAINPGMETQDEVVFSDYATEAELLAAFPGRSALLDAEAKAQARVEVIAQIEALESTQPRAIREAVLIGDKTRLQGIEDQIATLRAKLA